MTPLGRPAGPEGATAAVLGGAVTRERVQAAAARDGRGGSPLIRSLLAQSLPSNADLARTFGAGGPLRLDASLVEIAPLAMRLLDPRMLRRERCVPVEILDDLCVLAVEEGGAERAVQEVRAALRRDVLPVFAPSDALARALERLGGSRSALSLGPARRHDSFIHARFRDLVLEGAELDAVGLTGGGDTGFRPRGGSGPAAELSGERGPEAEEAE